MEQVEELLGRLRTQGKSPDAPSAHAPRRLQVLFLRLYTYFVQQVLGKQECISIHPYVLPSVSRQRDAGATLCMNYGITANNTKN